MNSATINPVKILVDFYKERGISCEEILNDPVFRSMSLDEQVDALRQYGADIKAGIKPTFFSKRIAHTALKGALLGAGVVIPTAIRHAMGFPISPGLSPSLIYGLAIGGGAALGAVSGASNAKKEQAHKAEVNKYLSSLASDKTSPIKLMSSYRPVAAPKLPGEGWIKEKTLVTHDLIQQFRNLNNT